MNVNFHFNCGMKVQAGNSESIVRKHYLKMVAKTTLMDNINGHPHI